MNTAHINYVSIIWDASSASRDICGYRRLRHRTTVHNFMLWAGAYMSLKDLNGSVRHPFAYVFSSARVQR